MLESIIGFLVIAFIIWLPFGIYRRIKDNNEKRDRICKWCNATYFNTYNDGFCSNRCKSEHLLNEEQRKLSEEQRKLSEEQRNLVAEKRRKLNS